MEDYKEKLLKALVEKYRSSKKDSGENKIVRRTSLLPSELYLHYHKNDGNLEVILAINEAAADCAGLGFITYEQAVMGYEIKKIYLVDEKTEEVEIYLSRYYNYHTKAEQMQAFRRSLEQYDNHTPAASAECKRLRANLDKKKLPKHTAEAEDILKALVFIEGNQCRLYLREASMLIYGSSKYLEEHSLDAVCRILREYRQKPCREDELPDEILKTYHIFKEEQKLCIKGNCSIEFSGTCYDLSSLRQGMEFSTAELPGIQKIELRAGILLSVENKTSYLRCDTDNAVVFYLGGYANRFQRDFLKLVYRDNPGIRYCHFGDIDAGGFLIHEHLCQITGIPFEMLYMSEEQLSDPRFQNCLQRLSANDIRRLQPLQDKESYRNVVRYMLEHHVKLEQEIISYFLDPKTSANAADGTF